MAIFPASSAAKRNALSSSNETALGKAEHDDFAFDPASLVTATHTAAAPRAGRDGKESLIASNLSIEGRIQGAGHVRIAGRFKGDIHVEGDLTIELGAKLSGAVRARKVVVGGELEGNIEAAERVELLPTGAMTGDIKAGSVTVAAGARLRGQVEFGWGDAPAQPMLASVDATERDAAA